MRCAQDNLGVKKVLAPSKYPLKWPIMYLAQQKKTYSPHFQNQRCIGNFMSLCNHGPSILWLFDRFLTVF